MIRKLFKGHKFKFIALAAVVIAVAGLGFTYMEKGAKAVDCGAAPSFPAFNIWPLSYSPTNCSDLPMVDVKALTGSGRAAYSSSAAEHTAGVAVAPGDKVRVRMYIHNGASPADQSVATARNVFVASQIQANSTTSHNVSDAYIADNANAAYSFDASHGGDTLITSSTPTTLAYEPGSTNACISSVLAQQKINAGQGSGIDMNSVCGTESDGTPMVNWHLPDGVFNGSVNIGDLPACFPYSAFITFNLLAQGQTTTPTTTLALTKLVRNVNNNESFASNLTTTNATNGQVVEFQLTPRNTGSATATSVNVTDTLPAGLQFVPGSVRVNGSQASDSLMTTGINIGDLTATNLSANITFRANVTATSGTLTNNASAQGTNTNNATASASVVVSATPTGSIDINKTVRNTNRGGSTAFTKSVNAQPNDVVDFQVVVTAGPNASVDNIVVTDTLPSGLQYIPGSVTMNGTAVSDNLVNGSGSTLGTLNANGTATYQFSARVTQSTAGTLTNNVSLASSVGSKSSSADVIVQPIITPTGSIDINKTVRNTNRGGSTAFTKSVNAQPNDVVDFQVVVTAGTNAAVNNIVVSDVLPSGLTYVPGSVTFNGTAVSDNLVNGNGSTLGTLNAGASGTYQFSARVTQSTAGTLINTASLTSSVGSKSDTANVVVAPIITPTGTINLSKFVRNVTAGHTAFVKQENAISGDVVEFQVVVTTGPNAAVNNIVVTDTLPSGLQYISGSVTMNGTTVSDNLVNGSGSTLGTLNASGTATYKFQARVTQVTAATLTNTASLTSSAGNASDTATVVIQPGQGTSALTISKTFRDLTQGQVAYTSNSNVYNNDVLQFQIVVTNTGTTAVSNINVTDTLPSTLNFINGTFGVTAGSSTSLNNVTVSSLAPGQNFVINYNAQVSIPNPTASSCGVITNTANLSATGISNQSSSATINVICNPQSTTLTISKLVKNITQGNSSYTKSVSANPGDRIGYQITIQALNGPATNVTLNESIPGYFNYAAGSARMNGNTFADSFTNSTVNIGSLSQGQADVITYEGNVSSNMPNGQTNIINTATASADRMGTINDSASVIVNVNPPSGFTQLSISKLVRNNNSGSQNFFQKSVNANTGDRVTFQVTVNNIGTQTANNVWLTDLLPNGLSYVNGSARLDNGSSAVDQVIGNRLYLGQMTAGSQHTLTFDATVNNVTTAATLTNTAQAGADNLGTVQDTANVFTSAVLGTNVSLSFSKTAFNSNRNVDATSVPAAKGDSIIYTLTTVNNGNAPANNFIVTDDLSGVLNYADMADLGGGTLNGTVISWPAMTIPANSTVTKSFTVRVKNSLPSGSLSMINTYGNTVTVHIVQPLVLGAIFVAPKTGVSTAVGLSFAVGMTVLFWFARRKGYVSALLRLVPKIRIE